MPRPRSHQDVLLLYLPWQFDLFGGVDVVVDRLYGRLAPATTFGTLIGIQNWGGKGLRSDQQGRQFLHLNIPDLISIRRTVDKSITVAKWLPMLAFQLASNRIALVNAHYPTTNLLALALLKQLGLWRGKIVLSFHGSDVASIHVSTKEWRFIAKHTTAITACSHALAERIQRSQIFEGFDIHVAHNGIDVSTFTGATEDSPRVGDGPYLLQVGSYVPGKGQDTLIEAFAAVADEFPAYSVVFAGGRDTGEWLMAMKQKVAALGLKDRSVFLENQSQTQIAALMQHATALVHPARDEPFGLVLIEAGATGLPVVATSVGGVPEIISSADFGILIPPDSPEVLARAIREVLNDQPAAHIVAERFRKRVMEQFSVDAMVSTYVRVYRTECGFP